MKWNDTGYLAVFFLSLAGTWAIRHFAIRVNMLDIPNQRSSHSTPVPRGGGLAIIAAFLLGLIFLLSSGKLSLVQFWAFSGPAFLVGMVGFLDDRYKLSAKCRLLFHILAAGAGIYALGGMPTIIFPGFQWTAGLPLNIFALFYVAWMINLYNFMDGIDGLAAVEAVTTGLGAALIYFLTGHTPDILLPLLYAAAAAGFLFWNFPPARIFMGDAGSGFTGLMAALLSIYAGCIDFTLFWSWLILSAVFIVDASWTLGMRAVQGFCLSEAHCSHAFQHAAKFFGRHSVVTLSVALINCFILWPVAYLVAIHWLNGFLGFCLVCLPLVGLTLKFNAGKIQYVHKY